MMGAERESFPLHDETPPRNWRVVLVVAVLLVVAGAAGFFWLRPAPAEQTGPGLPEELPPLTADAQAYLPQIELGRPDISRFENFLGQEVIYIDIPIRNRGPRAVLALELSLEFVDVHGSPVGQERVRAVGASSGSPPHRRAPLGPNASTTVRAAFEKLPPAWNRGAPRVQIVSLLLGETP